MHDTVCERVSYCTREAIYLGGVAPGCLSFAEAFPRGGIVRYRLVCVPPSLLEVVAEEGEAAIALPWCGNALLRFVVTHSIRRQLPLQPTIIGRYERLTCAFYVRVILPPAPPPRSAVRLALVSSR